jgi:hypothetical protein
MPNDMMAFLKRFKITKPPTSGGGPSALLASNRPKKSLEFAMARRYGECMAKKREADSASAFPQAMSARESSFRIMTKFNESDTEKSSGNKFRVVLIKEGMGNMKDAFFYSKAALSSAVPVFEGKKIYADHPSSSEEQTRPERSVKDVLGHFENVELVDEDGQSMLEADLIILPGDHFDWAATLMSHAVEYSKQYPDKDFIGLSINAAGDADPMPIDDLIKDNSLADACIEKLTLAKSQGIETIRFVKEIKDAVSCDLVTEAGAGGRIKDMI